MRLYKYIHACAPFGNREGSVDTSVGSIMLLIFYISLINYHAYNSWKENHVFLASMAFVKMHVAMLVIVMHEEVHACKYIPCMDTI